jgi:hypothetical protein
MTIENLSKATKAIDVIKSIKQLNNKDGDKKVDLAKLTKELVRRHQDGVDIPE